MKADFWFEFASTYSYPAAMRIEARALEMGVDLAWRPFLLGPIFRDQGWRDSPFNLYPAKGNYMWRDLERICADWEITFRRPSEFPRSGILAARVAWRYSGESWLPEFVRAVYRANFAEDLDISSAATIRNCLAPLVDDPDAVLKQAGTQDAKDGLRAQTKAATVAGIFGAPSFMVGGELFWGNDRLEDALRWALAHGGIVGDR